MVARVNGVFRRRRNSDAWTYVNARVVRSMILPTIRPPEKEVLSFGARLGEVMQIAYVVPDIHAAMAHWTHHLGVGPFFHFPHFALRDAEYRGEPCELDVDLALAYSGGMCFELIQQNDASPSVFREVVEKRGYGFHHWAVSTRDFDGLVETHRARGNSLALYGVADVGARAGYVDTFDDLGGMIELIELRPEVEQLFTVVRDAANAWDGHDPVRGF